MSEFWVPPRSSDLGNRLAEGEAGFCLNRRVASAPMPRPSVLGSGVRASPRPGVEPPAVVRTRSASVARASGLGAVGGGEACGWTAGSCAALAVLPGVRGHWSEAECPPARSCHLALAGCPWLL